LGGFSFAFFPGFSETKTLVAHYCNLYEHKI
jgi:hypothetical protein